MEQKPDDTESNRVEVGDIEMTDHEFIHMLESIDRAAESIEVLKSEVDDINTGLTEEDAIRLLYGRSNGWSLGEIRNLFDTMNTISGSSDRKLIIRLLANLGNTSLDDAEEFYEEVNRLRQRYGDLANDTSN